MPHGSGHGGAASGDHAGHPAPATAPDTPAAPAFREAKARMRRDKDVPLPGKADVDLVRAWLAARGR